MLETYLNRHWVPIALIMAIMLIALAPIGIGDRSTAMLLLYLALPTYMLHQVEEHTGDRFRTFVNTTIFGGVEALTTADVLWINIPGVWGLGLVCLYAASAFGHGLGLTLPYLLLVNAITHVVGAVRLRAYNPGLVTAVILFLPLAIVSLLVIPATADQHAFGSGVALVIHGGIVVIAILNVRRVRLQRLS